MLSILYGILSAGTWGAADFFGGLASKRTNPYRVLFLSEMAGVIPFIVLVLLTREPLPDTSALLLGAVSSVLGLTGLVLLYRALADGQMTVAAPVSAVSAALVPVIFGFFTLGLPQLATLLGFGLAFLAVWFISQTDGTSWHSLLESLRSLAGTSPSPSASSARLSASLRLPLLSGLFFGLYFILIHQATLHAVFWPLIAARCAGIMALGLYARLARQPLLPPRDTWGLCIVNGLLDLGGNAFYVLAAQAGRFDVAAVLGALYPASTVLLAWVVLKERINWLQGFGVVLAFAAIVLFTL